MKQHKIDIEAQKSTIPQLEEELLRISKKVGDLAREALELQNEIDRRKRL